MRISLGEGEVTQEFTMLGFWSRQLTAVFVLAIVGFSTPADEPPKGKGKGKDPAFVKDRDTFHFLLENHKAIKRTVKKLDNGVETITESDKPEVTKKIQEHVPAMYERLKSGDGVRYWDPLFAEAFKHGKKMKMDITNTKTGVKVVETSEEAEVVKIIQAHAEVVTKFVEKGFDEAHKEHPLPGKEKAPEKKDEKKK